MNIIDINSLPLQSEAELSDIFEVYNLSGSTFRSEIVTFADLSNVFYTTESFEELSSKYDELLDLMDSFIDFLKKNYPDSSLIPKILTTEKYFKEVMSDLQTIDKAKSEILNEYATTNYADLKKASAYKYHEMLAVAGGAGRSAILGSVTLDEDSNNDEDDD